MTPPVRRPIVVTMGEPAGISAEITLKAWRTRSADAAPFVVVDDAERLRSVSDALDLGVPVRAVDGVDEAAEVVAEALPVLHRPLPEPPVAGRPDARNAPAVIAAIETAVGLARDGEAAAVVTNPIHKAALYDAGFAFPGHTEFLASLASETRRPVMMLVAPELRVVPVTIHVALRRAIAELTTDAIVDTAAVVADALRDDFGIASPRLAVAGLNPHGGESGAMGSEDDDIVAPAVEVLRMRGIAATGPLPPDTMFAPRARADYDAAICMYHDQALIPLKTLDVDHGVNVTLGLPFVRTSPDHGTALDIAGTGAASETSLVAALAVAADIAERRAGATR